MAVRDTYTKLLLQGRGADASTVIVDETDKIVTAVGNAQIDTAQYKFGTGSILFDGTTDSLTTPDNADWAFGTGDFTIDFWFRPAATPTNYDVFIGQFEGGGSDANQKVWKFDYGNGGRLRLEAFTVASYINTTIASYQVTDAQTFSADTWYHLALVRNGTNIYIFKDGVSLSLTATTAISTNSMPDVSAVLTIGLDQQNSGRDINGHIDELRVSKGIARWTANFTPPIEAYDSRYSTLGEYLGAGSATTKLLLHLNGNSTDSSGNGNNGTDTNITYSQANGKFGQGAGFNGSTSKIALPATTSVKGLTQVTFSMWVKKTANPASQDIVYFESTNNALGYSRLNFAINTDGTSLCVWRDTESGSAYDTSMGTLGNNIWYNVISVFDSVGDTIKNYVNGNLVSTTSGSIGAIPNTAPSKEIRITTNNSGLVVDETFIEAKAWTASEVRKYFTYSRGRFGL